MNALEIAQQIEHDFHNLSTFEGGHIAVSVTGDTVVLKGHVGTWAEYDEAEVVALGAPGVRRVENLLGISP
ncbi:MAG TPA: BON domain-containing protein [Candidatus Baltobacteraceae bacterium]|nr:BON domain-containing protein [Candidatus Baltobacteraceae bacterium]